MTIDYEDYNRLMKEILPSKEESQAFLKKHRETRAKAIAEGRYVFKDKYSYADKTQIKKDWLKYFPEMAYSKKKPYLIIKKMVGPLILSIDFELRQFLGSDYRVNFSVQNLLETKPPEIGGYWAYFFYNPPKSNFTYQEHFMETKYKEAAVKIIENSPVKPIGPLSLQDIAKAYWSELDNSRQSPHVGFLKLLPLVASWCGEVKQAREHLARLKNKLPSYYTLNGLKYDPTWFEDLVSEIEQPEMLRERVRAEVKKHQFEWVPYYNIENVPYKE